MAAMGVTPTIRVRDMKVALDFYERRLGFHLTRGDPDAENCSLDRGDAHIMLELAADLYSPGYNAAIRQRMGARSANALYIEADDLEELQAAAVEGGVQIAYPLADRPWGQSEFTLEDPEGNWLTFWRATPD